METNRNNTAATAEPTPAAQAMSEMVQNAEDEKQKSIDRLKSILVKGQRVHCILHGGIDGTIYRINGEQQPETCQEMGGVMVTGGNAYFDIVWDGLSTTNIPESLLRTSSQWGILDEPLKTDEEITELLKAVEVKQGEIKSGQEEVAARRVAEREALPAKYPYLITVEKNDNKLTDQALAAKNIRLELKKAFPGVKFSIRSKGFAGGNSVDIGWEDGPTSEEVQKIGCKYEQGSFNGMEDIYEYNSDNVFSDVFGSVKYVMESRYISSEKTLEAAKDFGYPEVTIGEHKELLGIEDQDTIQAIHRQAREKNYYTVPQQPAEIIEAEIIELQEQQTTTEEPAEAATETTPPKDTEATTEADTLTEDKEPATIGEYKTNPVIGLPMGPGRSFTFGLTKAKKILEYVEEIQKFVKDKG